MFTIVLTNGVQIIGDVLDSSLKECPNQYMSTCSNTVIAQHLREVSNMHSFFFIHAADSDQNPHELRNKVISINPAEIVIMY